MPFLEENEWEQIEPLLKSQLQSIKNVRQKTGCSLAEAREIASKSATGLFFEMTGYVETNYATLYHHRLSDYGPECTKCGYLFRTPMAKHCANCGNLIENNTY